jgi:hypothetical protein
MIFTGSIRLPAQESRYFELVVFLGCHACLRNLTALLIELATTRCVEAGFR